MAEAGVHGQEVSEVWRVLRRPEARERTRRIGTMLAQRRWPSQHGLRPGTRLTVRVGVASDNLLEPLLWRSCCYADWS